MSVLPIIQLYQPYLFNQKSCLRIECEDVTDSEFSEEWFHKLIEDMFETLYAGNSGIGLSANQLGILKKISVIDLKRDAKKPLVFVNPQVIPLSDEIVVSDEVCLSFPNISAKVERYKKIKVLYQDIHGIHKEVIAEGFKSNVFQHEISHLYGKPHVDMVKSLDDIIPYIGTPKRKAEIVMAHMQDETNS